MQFVAPPTDDVGHVVGVFFNYRSRQKKRLAQIYPKKRLVVAGRSGQASHRFGIVKHTEAPGVMWV
jgi:hypothetical protein